MKLFSNKKSGADSLFYRHFSRNADRYDALIVLGMIIYSSVLSYLSLFRYYICHEEYDLAIFHQSFWNTLTGSGILTNSLEGSSHFGVHFSPILLTLMPVYALFPDVQTLLVMQTILLSLGAIPIYLFGRETLGKRIGCIFGLLYLVFPAIFGVNLYDFHEVAFLPFLLGMALWGYLTGRKEILIIFGVLSLLVKEDVSLIILMIGLIGLFKSRKDPLSEKWRFLLLTIGSIGILLTFLIVIRPFFMVPGSPQISGFFLQYHDVFSNLSQYNENRLWYFLMLFIPLIMLPFGSPEILFIGIPSFMEIFLSPNPYYFSINNQYSALVIPVLFMAAIGTLAKIKKGSKKYGRKLVPYIICLTIISTIICSGMFSLAASDVYLNSNIGEPYKEHKLYLDWVISVMPDNVSVATQENLLPQISKRGLIWKNYHEDADIILFDTAFPQRAAVFTNDMKKIEANFTCISNNYGIYVFVNNKNNNVISEMKQKITSIPVE